MTHLRGVLFDLDGVLLDSRHSVVAFWEQLAQRHDVELTPQLYVKHILGVPARHTLDHVFPMLGENARLEVIAEIHAYEAGLRLTPMPGAIACVTALHNNRVPIGLVTSASRDKALQVLDAFDIREAFAGIVTASDVTCGKPHPEPYQCGAEALGLPASACLVFEDSVSGTFSAAGAGATCIGINVLRMKGSLEIAGSCVVVQDLAAVHIEPRNDGVALHVGTRSFVIRPRT
ncbi:MAG: HAD family phosphatase [Bacteroidota bacterium]